MKQVYVEETIKVPYWEACDGTKFRDKAECEKYDNSAKAVLLSQYNKLIVKEASEYEIFGSGSEDNSVEVIKVNSEHDVDVVMKLLGVLSPCMLRDDFKDNYNQKRATLEEAANTKDIVFIYRGYEKDCFCIDGTLTSRIKHIQEFCKIEQDE